MNRLTEQDRLDLGRMVLNILEEWGVSTPDQVTILALPDKISARHLRRFHDETPLPDDPDVLVGLVRVQFELGQYGEARETIEQARAIDPAATEPFAYIAGGDSESARASNAQQRDVMIWSE